MKIIADLNDVPVEVAEEEWKNVFLKLSRTGEMTQEQAEAAMEINQLTGIDNLPEAADIWTDALTPVSVTTEK